MLFIFFSFLQSLFLLSHGGFSSLCYFDAPVLFPSHGGFFSLSYLILKLNTHKYHPSLNLFKNNLTNKSRKICGRLTPDWFTTQVCSNSGWSRVVVHGCLEDSGECERGDGDSILCTDAGEHARFEFEAVFFLLQKYPSIHSCRSCCRKLNVHISFLN